MSNKTNRDAAHFYLLGRSDAGDDFEPEEDFDAEEIAQKVLDGADLHETKSKAIDAFMAMGDFTGSRAEWGADNAEELALVQISPDEAYKAWKRGYKDHAMVMLEDAIIDELAELEDDDSEEEVEYHLFDEKAGEVRGEATEDQVSTYQKKGYVKVDGKRYVIAIIDDDGAATVIDQVLAGA